MGIICDGQQFDCVLNKLQILCIVELSHFGQVIKACACKVHRVSPQEFESLPRLRRSVLYCISFLIVRNYNILFDIKGIVGNILDQQGKMGIR